MGNTSIDIKSKDNNLENIKVKDYIGDYKDLLDNIKKTQKIIMDSDTYEIPVLIKLAKRKLTKTAIMQSKEIIINLQKNFSDDGILNFIEKTISLVTTIETSNILYGDLIDIKEVREYISKKTSEAILLRVNKLLNQLKEISYDEKNKISFIVENLNRCNKIFEYCWEISSSNTNSLKYIITILNIFIKQRVKLSLDDYNIGLLHVTIENIEEKLSKNSTDLKEEASFDINKEFESNFDKNIVINENISTKDLVVAQSTTSDKAKVESSTQKFIGISNDVLDDVLANEKENFINIAFQRYNSILATIETLNFFKGIVVDKVAVSKNISILLTDMIYTNFKAITNSWKEIENKTPEDYLAYYKEIYNYKKLLFEAYRINKDNIDALRKSIEIEIIIYKDYKKFNLSDNQASIIKNTIEEFTPVIKKVFEDFKGLVKEEENQKKKKGFWSKLFK